MFYVSKVNSDGSFVITNDNDFTGTFNSIEEVKTVIEDSDTNVEVRGLIMPVMDDEGIVFVPDFKDENTVATDEELDTLKKAVVDFADKFGYKHNGDAYKEYSDTAEYRSLNCETQDAYVSIRLDVEGDEPIEFNFFMQDYCNGEVHVGVYGEFASPDGSKTFIDDCSCDIVGKTRQEAFTDAGEFIRAYTEDKFRN